MMLSDISGETFNSLLGESAYQGTSVDIASSNFNTAYRTYPNSFVDMTRKICHHQR